MFFFWRIVYLILKEKGEYMDIYFLEKYIISMYYRGLKKLRIVVWGLFVVGIRWYEVVEGLEWRVEFVKCDSNGIEGVESMLRNRVFG